MPRAAKPTPDSELAALREKRLELAKRRDAHATAQGAAERVIEGSADRRAAALLAEARGQQPDPTVEQVDEHRAGRGIERRRQQVRGRSFVARDQRTDLVGAQSAAPDDQAVGGDKRAGAQPRQETRHQKKGQKSPKLPLRAFGGKRMRYGNGDGER